MKKLSRLFRRENKTSLVNTDLHLIDQIVYEMICLEFIQTLPITDFSPITYNLQHYLEDDWMTQDHVIKSRKSARQLFNKKIFKHGIKEQA